MKYRVIDFFCGGGGFSEGFRQMGFEIIYGYDKWLPAVNTFNYNFNLECEKTDISKFYYNIDLIEALPDTEVIIGSPPCVSFSSSNKSGGADKSLGILLTKSFLRIIAVKKHQPASILKGWFMENVANSIKYLQDTYSFEDLNLTEWAENNGFESSSVAINIKGNYAILNASDYGSLQARKRAICGEFISFNKFIIPKKLTHQGRRLSELFDRFPTPFTRNQSLIVRDPNYKELKLKVTSITDHFYDTGLYQTEWMQSKFLKTSHPYMGKMSFPENTSKPSRTITATKIANSRESIVYKSEINRLGNGEYRLPTVREAAIIMGFPINYQFVGGESTKWRLIGNAVCCAVSRALAKEILISEQIPIPEIKLPETRKVGLINNLNDFQVKVFDSPPRKKSNARFRRHMFKDGNLTVTLTNYNFTDTKKTVDGNWYTSIQYGTGAGFPVQQLNEKDFKKTEQLINKVKLNNRDLILYELENIISNITCATSMQNAYENTNGLSDKINPISILENGRILIQKYTVSSELITNSNSDIFLYKSKIPVNQLFAVYFFLRICIKVNKK